MTELVDPNSFEQLPLVSVHFLISVLHVSLRSIRRASNFFERLRVSQQVGCHVDTGCHCLFCAEIAQQIQLRVPRPDHFLYQIPDGIAKTERITTRGVRVERCCHVIPPGVGFIDVGLIVVGFIVVGFIVVGFIVVGFLAVHDRGLDRGSMRGRDECFAADGTGIAVLKPSDDAC